MKITKLTEEELFDKMEDCVPTEMIVNKDKTLSEKAMTLCSWHRTHNITTFEDECKKLEDLLGHYIFKGKYIEDTDTEFYTTQAIWGFYYKNEENVIVIYLSEEGLSLEISEEAEEYINDIYDILIDQLILKDNS